MRFFSEKINFPPFPPIFLAKISILGVRDWLFTQGIWTRQMMLTFYCIMFTPTPYYIYRTYCSIKNKNNKRGSPSLTLPKGRETHSTTGKCVEIGLLPIWQCWDEVCAKLLPLEEGWNG